MKNVAKIPLTRKAIFIMYFTEFSHGCGESSYL